MSTPRSRRHRNPQVGENERQQPFFSPTTVQTKTAQPFFQPKLSIGQPGDAYEREADAVADRVVSGQGKTPAVQRQEISAIQRATLATPQEDEKLSTAEARMEEDKLVQEKPELQRAAMSDEDKPLQAKEAPEEEKAPLQMQEIEEKEQLQTKTESGGATAAGSQLSSRLQSRSGKGQPLPDNTRAEMESAFGLSFGGVNVHTDTDAVQMNKELSAQAFTHGQDVFFNAGKYRPESSDGKRLLAHELTHVVQQGGGLMKLQLQSSEDRSRQSKPVDAPRGTRPIDQSGLDREDLHKIKDQIGAGPRDWVGITPDGHVITTDEEGHAEDHGHMDDYLQRVQWNPDISWSRLLDIISTIVVGLSLILLIAYAILSPEPTTKLIAAGLSMAMILIIMRRVSKESSPQA